MSTEHRSRAWMEVDGAALRRNLARIRDAVGPEVRLLPVVKADAYGLGLATVIASLEPEAPWGYGVATVLEGRAVRARGVERPVVVLGPTPRDLVPPGVDAGLTFCVSSVRELRWIAGVAERRGRPVPVHVEVDTGMGRAGFDWREVATWGPEVRASAREWIRWEGLFTHLHSADEPESDAATGQVRRLDEVLETVTDLAGRDLIVHICHSAGALRRPDWARGLVRPGIFLYGGVPGEGLPQPEQVVAVRARVVLERRVAEGTTLGYGATYRARRPERWATAAIGYGDGLPRALGNRGQAIVHGRRVPIIGRISMDLTVVDITDVPDQAVEVGDAITFVGTDGDERIALEEVARHAGTISYEILTGLSPRLPRIWKGVEGDEGSDDTL